MPLTLDTNLFVNDHQFNMATALLELIVYRLRLVLAHVVVHPKTGLLFVTGQRVVKPITRHFVDPILKWQQLACVIVAQTQVAGDDDSAADSAEKGLQ